MKSPGLLVAELRARSGLSQRALARRAGCTRSTITRIESGEMDPTITMLARIAGAAGYRLNVDASELAEGRSLAAIASQVTQGSDGSVPWTRLRGLLDWVKLHPDRGPAAIADPPTRTGSDRLDNLFAGVAEKVADDSNTRRPVWTQAVHPLLEEWTAPGTPRMRALEKAAAPPQFIVRNILLAEENLWRLHD